MKKTYIIPELEVVRIKTQQMLAASVPPELSGKAYEGEDILAPGMDLDGYFDGGDNLDNFFE